LKDYENRNKYPTLKDVAERAGVSPITVSRVFNEKWQGKVKEDTVNKVLDAAKYLGYSPNRIARSLNSDKTNIIAVVIGEQTGVYYNAISHQIVKGIQNSGRQALVFVADHSYGMKKIVRQVNEYRVDGIIVTSPATKTQVMNFLYDSKIPILLFNRKLQHSSASAVWCESTAGMEKLVGFLVDNDLKTLSFIKGFGEKERNNAFIEKAKEKGIKIQEILDGDYTYESGYQKAVKILSNGPRPDVIVSGDDNMALGVIDAARLEFNLGIPEDISVIGFDDNELASLKSYDLTTIRQPVEEMLDFMFEMLEDLMDDPSKQILRSYEAELVIRGSVKLKSNK